jgi:Zn-dependent M28 family amino/carboxypeptidase
LKRLLFFLLACLPLCLPAGGRERPEELRLEVEFFADSLLAGRATGSPGAQMATFYLVRQLRDAGLLTTVQSFTADGRIGHNVVAVTPGYFSKYVVVSAYLDGLGTLDGTLYPGADANASGLAALLALAREFNDGRERMTGLIFVAFDGHNADLAGSRAFLERYRGLYPISLMVNLDILGSTLAPVKRDHPNYLMALGGREFWFNLESASFRADIDLTFDYYGSDAFTRIFYRQVSDQRWFLEAGIPAVMFTSGITMNTNKATDTPDTLDYDIFERRIQLIARWLRTVL